MILENDVAVKLVIRGFIEEDFDPIIVGYLMPENGIRGIEFCIPRTFLMTNDMDDFESEVLEFANDLNVYKTEISIVYWTSETHGKIRRETREKVRIDTLTFKDGNLKIKEGKWKKTEEKYMLPALEIWKKRLIKEYN